MIVEAIYRRTQSRGGCTRKRTVLLYCVVHAICNSETMLGPQI